MSSFKLWLSFVVVAVVVVVVAVVVVVIVVVVSGVYTRCVSECIPWMAANI